MARDLQTVKTRSLTAAQYEHFSDVPPDLEWPANITNKKTRSNSNSYLLEITLTCCRQTVEWPISRHDRRLLHAGVNSHYR